MPERQPKSPESDAEIKEYEIIDLLRGSGKTIRIRTNVEDFVELECHCNYDPQLVSKSGNRARLLRKIEIQNEDGSWETYPSATWIDSEEIYSVAMITKMGEGGIDIMRSSYGVPDAKLLLAAEKAEIHTEYIDL